jgi:pimeloyl-ACP methyl ester carboxylesterase
VRVEVEPGVELHCRIDDFLFPWVRSTPVFMLHGADRNGLFWNGWVPTLADDRRIYRLDLRGCGESDIVPRDYRFDLKTILGDIQIVVDALGLERFHWVGESSGGLIGTAFAATFPERVASLVLCDAPTKIPDALKSTYAMGESSTSDAFLRYGVRERSRRTAHVRLDLERASQELQDWYVEEMARVPAYIAAAYSAFFTSADVRPMLKDVQAPVLLLSGAKSKIAGEQQAILQSELPNAKLRLFEGYGHGVSVLAPRECAREALRFWDGIDAGG